MSSEQVREKVNEIGGMMDRTQAIKDVMREVFRHHEAGNLSREQARSIECLLKLTREEDQILALRLLDGGPDPASIEYLERGGISGPVMDAHRNGPSGFQREEGGQLTTEHIDFLVLASLSSDEAQRSTLRSRVMGFCAAMNSLGVAPGGPARDTNALIGGAIEHLKEILDLPFTETRLDGVEMRLYESDRGFCAAFWSEDPPKVAAVRDESGAIFVGCRKGFTLDGLGVGVDKRLSPAFGVVFAKPAGE